MKGKTSRRTGDGVQAFIEKRGDLRSPLVVLEVKWKHYNKVFIAHASNISMGGLLLSADRPVQVGERFPIEFVLPDEKTKVSCAAEVVWTKRHGPEGSASEGVGVRFVDIDDKKMKAIEQWIKRQEAAAKKER